MKRRQYVFVIITLIICASIVLICNKSSDNATILDEVKLKDNEINKKQFAMYIRDNKNEEYKEYSDGTNLFPVGYKLDLEESGCVDDNGEKVEEEGIITQTEDGKVMVASNKTLYCYLYFEKEPTASETLTTNPSSYLKEGDHGDLHWRYVGKQEESDSINNYVCFGINDCNKEATNDHLYRIIGITKEGNLKIQKNSSVGTSKWWTEYNIDKSWPESNIYSLLTGDSFYNNANYVTQEMKSKIEMEHIWNTGDVNDAAGYSNGKIVYNTEYNNGNSTYTGAIGLAYLSDYYYSYQVDGNQNCFDDPYCKSWIIPSNYQILWSNTNYEWTMTRYACCNGVIDGLILHYSGQFTWVGINNAYAIRPVFYLKFDVKINGGEGTLNSPYIIN